MKDFKAQWDEQKDKTQQDDLDYVTEVLKSFDESIEMPESLRGKNLLHLIEDEKPEKQETNSVIDWLFSKKAVPLYSLVVAAALLIMVVPRLQTRQTPTMPEAAGMEIEANAEDDTDAVMAAAPQQQEAPEAEADNNAGAANEEKPDVYEGEDLTAGGEQNFPDSTKDTNEKDDKEDKRPPSDTDPRAEDTEDSYTAETKPRQVEDEIKTGGGETQPENEQSDEPAVATFRNAPATYYIGEAGGYSLYWQSADPTNKEHDKYTILINVMDSQDKLHLQQGISHIRQVIYMYSYGDKVYLVGIGDDGASVTSYTGLDKGELNRLKTQNLPAIYKDSYQIDKFLYSVSLVSSDNITPDRTNVTLPTAGGKDSFIITIVNLEKDSASQFVITGVNENSRLSMENDTMKIIYTTIEGIESEATFTLQNGNVTLK